MRLPDYTVTGDGKVTVFLLHGIYGSKEYWRYQTERLLTRGYRVVTRDPGARQPVSNLQFRKKPA